MEHPAKKPDKPARVHRLPTRARRMLWLLVAVAAAAVLVVLLPTLRARFPGVMDEQLRAKLTFRTLEVGDAKVLESITVTPTDGERYTLVYRDQALYLRGADGSLALINESYSDQIVKAATEIAVEDTVTEDVAEVAEHLGDVYEKLGEMDKAREFWLKALQLDGTRIEAKEKYKNAMQ